MATSVEIPPAIIAQAEQCILHEKLPVPEPEAAAIEQQLESLAIKDLGLEGTGPAAVEQATTVPEPEAECKEVEPADKKEEEPAVKTKEIPVPVETKEIPVPPAVVEEKPAECAHE